MAAEHEANRVEGLELIMERTFDAPQQVVFSMFTESDHLANWWGPTGWNTTTFELDLVPGGVWHYCMLSPDGQEAWGKSVYQEIEAPGRLVYEDNFSDEQGNISNDMPTMLVTTDFIEKGNRTTIVSRTKFESQAELQKVLDMGAIEGMTETFDRLDGYLADVQT